MQANHNQPSMNPPPEPDHGKSVRYGFGAERISQFLREEARTLLSVSREHKEAVRNDILVGSVPDMRYYILLAISSLIAALGLVTDSPAIVIGAMLISPLMTPIFGISLGLLRGNVTLLRRALIGEFGGVALAIFVAMLLGFLPIPFDITKEMLARTEPTLLDLGVATLAGLAGCMAMIDERISPVLPGIAIATAIVPPLATSGLCIALGAYQGAWGAFLLFFANFLAILIVSFILFVVAGFVHRREMGSKLNVLRRLSSALIGFVIVGFLLTQTLMGMVENVRVKNVIESVLEIELSDEPATAIYNLLFKKKDNTLDILATVRTPRVLTSRKINDIQNKIAERLGMNTQLIVRCDIVTDVSATGSTSAVVSENLDGEFISTNLNPTVKRFQLAEQTLREVLEDQPALSLREFDLLELKQGPLILATIQSSRRLSSADVAEFEKIIQQRLDDPELRLLIRSEAIMGISSKGRVLYGRAHFGNLPEEELATQKLIEETTRSAIGGIKNMFVTAVDAMRKDDGWAVRAQVYGPRVLSPTEVKAVENKSTQVAGQPVKLDVWSHTELVVTSKEYIPLGSYSNR
jgi:uncharacterized hydrophobic protein (TIGR00271 family)